MGFLINFSIFYSDPELSFLCGLQWSAVCSTLTEEIEGFSAESEMSMLGLDET